MLIDATNIIIFGVDNSSFVHINGRNKKILVLGKYRIHFTDQEKN